MALSSEELGVYGSGGPKELPFVNMWRYLRSLTDAVPAIYDVSARLSTLLLLEDVGDVTLCGAAEASGAAGLDRCSERAAADRRPADPGA